MGRSIVTKVPAPAVAARAGPGSEVQAATSSDSYGDALLKLIPAEVIGVYLAMQSILSNANSDTQRDITYLVVFLFGVFATCFYLRVSLKVTNKIQLLLSVGAFCVWAYSMMPKEYYWYDGTHAGLLLLAYTFIAPKIPLEIKRTSQ
jgi:hypothetical protein